MGILDKLKPQPRWKHVDAVVRLEALKELDDAVELALLAETDPDAKVRRAALGQIDDPVVLRRVAEGDTDADAQELAADRLFSLATTGLDGTAMAAVDAIKDPKRLSAVAKSAAPEAVCQSALVRTTDQRALTSIARHATHATVAAAAFDRITDPAGWQDLVLHAEHKDVALRAFDRLTAGTRDLEFLRAIESQAAEKAVAKKARALIQDIETAEAAARAAAEEHGRRQASLIETAERLVHVADPTAARGELSRLWEAWTALGDTAADARDRFSRAALEVDAAIARREREAEEAAELARQRAEALATRDALCLRVETLDGDDVLAQLVPIEEEWRSLLPLVGNGPEADRLAARFAVAVAACRTRHEMGARLADTRASLEARVVEAEQLSSHDDAAAAATRWTSLSREARELTAILSAAFRPAPADLVDRLRAVEEIFTGRDAARRDAADKARADLVAQYQRLIERAARASESDTITLREGTRLMRDIKTAQDELSAVGNSPDLDAAARRIQQLQEQIAPRVRELREMDEWRRFANAQQQEKLIAMAEAIVNSLKTEEAAGKESDLAATARALRELNAKWHEVADAPRNVAQRLWDRFRTATDYIRSRCAVHFEKLKEERVENLQKKAALVEEAESLVNSSDWVKTATRFRELQEAWQASGATPRDAARDLFRRFRLASNAFFARRREDLTDRKKAWTENLARKEALCARAEELATSTEWEAAAAEMKRMQADWKTIGPVRRKQSDAVWARFRAAADTFFERFHNRHQIALAGKLADREAMVVEIEALAIAENGHVPADLAERVQALRTTWNRAVPIPVPEMKALQMRWKVAVGQLVTKRPEMFAGTDLDPKAVLKKMEKLVARVQALVESADASPASSGLSQAEQLAARLRSALASNAMGGRAQESTRWRSAIETMREAEEAWRRLAPITEPEAATLEAAFHAACRRVIEVAREHGVDAHQRASRPASAPRPNGRPSDDRGGDRGGRPNDRRDRRPRPDQSRSDQETITA